MSSVKTAAAIVVQRGYRDRLERKAAGLLAEIEARVAAFQALPTSRLDTAATAVGLRLSSIELESMLGEEARSDRAAIAQRPRSQIRRRRRRRAGCAGPVDWLPATPARRETPFARTPGRPRVYDAPLPITTNVKAAVLALVDTQTTADAIDATLRTCECRCSPPRAAVRCRG
jgi:hypothetical protein